MKLKYFVFIIIFIFTITTTACSKDKYVYPSKINIKNTNKRVKAFLNICEDKNGVYLYNDNNKNLYLFLNGSTNMSEDKSICFRDIKIIIEDNILSIYFNEEYSSYYKHKELYSKLLYKFNPPEKIDTIKIFKNSKEIHFDSVIN
ncbi:hypothetical protein [Clostridium polynesiense]|uniref:hypothetical protein n=1 Tax=Clostridium polynesiense TaxID=1325933 RepID=UPI00058B9DA2|nr:hypothetical protein [Clostridium polynesiense]